MSQSAEYMNYQILDLHLDPIWPIISQSKSMILVAYVYGQFNSFIEWSGSISVSECQGIIINPCIMMQPTVTTENYLQQESKLYKSKVNLFIQSKYKVCLVAQILPVLKILTNSGERFNKQYQCKLVVQFNSLKQITDPDFRAIAADIQMFLGATFEKGPASREILSITQEVPFGIADQMDSLNFYTKNI